MRVVVVEDEPDIATVIRYALSDHDVTAITDPRLALDPAVWADVDCAIVDLAMPYVSGETVLSYLADNHPSVRRIVFTAAPVLLYNLPPDLAHDVLTKPGSPQAIRRAVEGR